MPGQRGVALIIVLWISVLLAVVVGSYIYAGRTEGLLARNFLESARARLAAEAGLHRVVLELQKLAQNERPIADGRIYAFEFDGFDVQVSVRSENGLIDINLADEQMLDALFSAAGLEIEAERLALIDAILDWRDPDDLVRLYGAEKEEYEAAGYPYGPSNRNFETIETLQQVIGMNYPLFEAVAPAVTVHSGQQTVNPAFAPFEVLRLLPGMDDEQARLYIEQREQISDPSQPLPLLPDGSQPVAQSGGLTYSIRSRASRKGGVWDEIDATILLGGGQNRRPFRILRLKKSYKES